ncbi:hypothetical protein K458DRAFT_289363, partial [Lentithecium fluviatile CBS 122367]
AGTTQDGFNCREKFICTRESRWVHATNITIDDLSQQVGGVDSVKKGDVPMNAKEVFGKVKDVLLKQWNKDSPVPISKGCYITFPKVTVPSPSQYYNQTTPDRISQVMVDYLGVEVEKTRKSTTKICSMPNRGGTQSKYKFDTLIYPRGGSFEVQLFQQSNPQPVEQTRIDWKITCPTPCSKGDTTWLKMLGNGLVLFGGWANPIFGMTNAGVQIAALGFEQCL